MSGSLFRRFSVCGVAPPRRWTRHSRAKKSKPCCPRHPRLKMDLRHLRSVQGRLLGFSVQLDPIGGKRETPAVWKDLQPCSGGKSPTLRRATRTCNLVRVAKARLCGGQQGLATLFGWKARLCGGRSGRCNTPTLRRARSKQHLISNGLVKWNTQREETDLWEVSNLRSARSLDNKHSAVTRERVG